jgi:hypothetical protein
MRAQAEAMQTGLSELGVTVSAESLMSAISDVRIDEDGRREIYREKSERNVVIKVADTEVRGAKVAYCTNSRNALEARVSLGIGEWHRIRRSKLGTTVIMLECRSPVPRVCKGAKLHALLRKAVVEAGLKPLSVLEPEEAMSPNSPKMVKRLGVHNDAGYILWVILEGQSKCGPGECKQLRQFVSVTTASLTLLDTGDGKTIHSWSSPDDCSYKVNLPSRMHYTLSDTLRKSMHGSVSGTDTCGAGVQQGLATWDKSAE